MQYVLLYISCLYLNKFTCIYLYNIRWFMCIWKNIKLFIWYEFTLSRFLWICIYWWFCMYSCLQLNSSGIHGNGYHSNIIPRTSISGFLLSLARHKKHTILPWTTPVYIHTWIIEILCFFVKFPSVNFFVLEILHKVYIWKK